MKILLSFILTIATLQINAAEQSDNNDAVLFYVDDEVITASMFREFYTSRGYKSLADPQQNKVQQVKAANELINILLMSKQAEADKLDQTEQVKQALEISRKHVLSKALVASYMKRVDVSDEELEKSYQQILQEAENRADYKASYILLDDEKVAKTVIEKLKKGEKFAQLAEKYSTENFANKNDSDTDWFSADSQEKEIAAAIKKLAVGEFTQEPVKTRFGWHVILVNDKKTQEVPPLTKIQDQLTDLVKQQKVRNEVAKLREKATVKTANQK